MEIILFFFFIADAAKLKQFLELALKGVNLTHGYQPGRLFFFFQTGFKSS